LDGDYYNALHLHGSQSIELWHFHRYYFLQKLLVLCGEPQPLRPYIYGKDNNVWPFQQVSEFLILVKTPK